MKNRKEQRMSSHRPENNFYNSERYADPTAYYAMKSLTKKDYKRIKGQKSESLRNREEK